MYKPLRSIIAAVAALAVAACSFASDRVTDARYVTAYVATVTGEWVKSTAERAHDLLFIGMQRMGLVLCVQAPFPVRPDLTAIAVSYRNTNMIADEVMPRVNVGKQAFMYQKFALAEGFTIPETRVGRRSPPNQVEFTSQDMTAETQDYALDDSIPNVDIENADPNQDPVARATLYTTNLIELDREVRVSNLLFNGSTYAAGNQSTLSGTGQWSDYANSNPVDAILNALDSMIMRPNIAVIGQSVWTKLRQHPKILSAIFGPGGQSGIAARQQVADILELDAIYVGTSFVNTAKKGQTATMQRVWGKHMALLHREALADNERGTTFGFTAQFGSRIAGSFEDKDIGMRGGTRVRVGESVKEVITANDLGYFFQNAIA